MDWRDKKIEQLERIIAERDATIAMLLERIAELERRLGLNSGNSSKPPSSDGFKKQTRIRSLREKSGKKSGGQPGHKGSTLQQVENPDSIESHSINHCPHCNTDLSNVPIVDTTKKQVFDIQPIQKPFVIEHQFGVKRCPGCHKKVTPQGDAFVNAPVQYGHNVKAAVVYLNVHNMIPENRTAQMMGDLYGISMSVATVENIAQDCVSNVKQVVDHIERDLIMAPCKGADESSVRINGKTYWLHTLSNDLSVHYRVSEKRGDIQKNLEGVVVHDGFVSYYAKLEKAQHALCNAHHLRELNAVIEIDKEPWAKDMKDLLLSGLQTSQQYQENIDTEWLTKFKQLYDQIISKGIFFHESLGVLKKPKRGKTKRRPGHNLLLRLKNYASDVLRFLENPEVPFTNNSAEQAIRMIKVKQKISGCFRTFEGTENFLVIRSYTATAQKQGFKTLDALAQVFQKNPFSLAQH